ncbi:tetratricopeptide repeat protein [Chroococcidiopsis sp.]|uniref:tetratricopeptide repeat protein n=1 Tax=Chroococcidiopsis sp. TaxID=3088168 RepID=UPI003F31F3C7
MNNLLHYLNTILSILAGRLPVTEPLINGQSQVKKVVWYNWFERTRLTFLVAAFALFLGVKSPWYSLPDEALKTFDTNLIIANLGRAIALLFALLTGAIALWFSRSRAARMLFWSGLFVVLLFPYFITTWSPTMAFLSAAYYKQGVEATHHVQRNFPKIQSQWKQNITLSQPEPIKSIASFSIKDSRFFQMSSWDLIWVEGFGYSNNFFAYIGRGWSATVAGLVIGLMAFYLGLAERSFNALISDMSRFLPWAGVAIALVVVSMLLPNFIDRHLDTLYAQGQYRPVVTISKILKTCYPPLQGDTEFLRREAEAGFYANQPDPTAIEFVKGLESYRRKDFIRAEEYFQNALATQPHNFLVREYLTTSILNQGVTYFNGANSPTNHQTGLAIERFERALQIFPAHIEALYDLMLARAANGEFDLSASVARQIIETQEYPQQSNLALLGQAYLHNSWASYHDGNIEKAWEQYRQSIDNKAWKDSGEAQE